MILYLLIGCTIRASTLIHISKINVAIRLKIEWSRYIRRPYKKINRKLACTSKGLNTHVHGRVLNNHVKVQPTKNPCAALCDGKNILTKKRLEHLLLSKKPGYIPQQPR